MAMFLWNLLLLVSIALADGAAAPSAKEFLRRGDDSYAKGRLSDAATYYNRALEIDSIPTTRWKLASVLIALNRYDEAAVHLSMLNLNDLPSQLARRPKVYLQLCRLDEAESDINRLDELREQQKGGMTQSQITAFRAKIQQGRNALRAVTGDNIPRNVRDRIAAYQDLVNVCTHSPKYWEALARTALNAFDSQVLQQAATRLTIIQPHSSVGQGYLACSGALSTDFKVASQQAEKVFNNDPDSKFSVQVLRPMIRGLRVLDKSRQQLDSDDENGAIRTIDEFIAKGKDFKRLLPTVTAAIDTVAARSHIKAGALASAEQFARDAVEQSSRVMGAQELKLEALLLRAEALEGMQDIDEAMRAAQQAREIAPRDQRVYRLLERLQNARAQESQIESTFEPGYYEALGVNKSAPDTEIRKAYRRLTRKYHPDAPANREASDSVKEQNAKKYEKIQRAYDVLGNKERRQQYDQAMARGFRPKRQDGFGFTGGFPGGFPFPGNFNFVFN